MRGWQLIISPDTVNLIKTYYISERFIRINTQNAMLTSSSIIIKAVSSYPFTSITQWKFNNISMICKTVGLYNRYHVCALSFKGKVVTYNYHNNNRIVKQIHFLSRMFLQIISRQYTSPPPLNDNSPSQYCLV